MNGRCSLYCYSTVRIVVCMVCCYVLYSRSPSTGGIIDEAERDVVYRRPCAYGVAACQDRDRGRY
jgi:hypothetical protein